jgi:PadR family transcriptional regulator AphA
MRITRQRTGDRSRVATSGVPGMSLTDWVVLAVIAEEPRHGFSVARELAPEAPIGQVWTVRRPLVYRSLEHLAVDRSIKASRTEPGTQGPHRTVYGVTRAGRNRLARWLTEPVEHPRDVRSELLVKFVLRARRGEPLTPLALGQLELFAPVADGLARAARRASGADRVVARWRLESTRAITRTLDAIIADEARGALDGAAVASRHAAGTHTDH